MNTNINKKVKMELVGLDGNAYSILGAFSNNARKQGWNKEEIDNVIKEAKSKDYNHLLKTIMSNVEDIDENEDQQDDLIYIEDEDSDSEINY